MICAEDSSETGYIYCGETAIWARESLDSAAVLLPDPAGRSRLPYTQIRWSA